MEPLVKQKGNVTLRIDVHHTADLLELRVLFELTNHLSKLLFLGCQRVVAGHFNPEILQIVVLDAGDQRGGALRPHRPGTQS